MVEHNQEHASHSALAFQIVTKTYFADPMSIGSRHRSAL